MLKDGILNVFNFQQCCCLHIAVTTTINHILSFLYIYTIVSLCIHTLDR